MLRHIRISDVPKQTDWRIIIMARRGAIKLFERVEIFRIVLA